MIILAAIAVMPALAVLVYDEIALYDARVAEVHGLAREQAGLANSSVSQIVEGVHNVLVALSRLPPVRRLDSAECNEIFGDLQRQYAGYLSIAAADIEGRVFCAGHSLRVTGPNVADRQFFQSAIATGDFVVGSFAISSATSEKVIHFSYPFFDPHGNVAGVVFTSLSLSWLSQQLKGSPTQPESVVIVADRNGTTLARRPDNGSTGQTMPQEYSWVLDEPHVGTADIVDPNGGMRIVGYVPSTDTASRMFMVVGLSREVAFADLRRAAWYGALLVIVSFLLALFGASFVGERSIRRPVQLLLDATIHWGAGEYGVRTGFTSFALEFRQLSAALDRMAALIERRDRELSEANRSKTRLLAAAGHDLKQPLQIISAAVWTLSRRGVEREDRERHVVRAERATLRLARALDNLLMASRIESGVLEPKRTVFPIGPILEEVADEFAPTAAEKGLRMTVVQSTITIVSDPDMLSEILQNLVSNAIKYTERGCVLIGCKRHGEMLSIHVADTGVGIPEDKIDAVFDEFYRLDPTSGSGMGLGLSIVKRMALLLGHPVHLRSTVGKGSCVTVEVPLADRSEANGEHGIIANEQMS